MEGGRIEAGAAKGIMGCVDQNGREIIDDDSGRGIRVSAGNKENGRALEGERDAGENAQSLRDRRPVGGRGRAIERVRRVGEQPCYLVSRGKKK